MRQKLTTPIPVKKALKKLGKDIREARIRRRIPVALMAERVGISRVTLKSVEDGRPTVSMGIYATALYVLGMLDRLYDKEIMIKREAKKIKKFKKNDLILLLWKKDLEVLLNSKKLDLDQLQKNAQNILTVDKIKAQILISLIDKTITIQRTVQRIYDKVKGTSYVYIGAPKTASSARTIPLPSLLVNIIKKYYTDSPNQYFLTGKNKPTEPRTYRQFFARFLKKHNLRNVKFHEIRHTFAVRAIEIPEFDVKSLSEILGHKNVSFTLNVYGRANMQQKIKCMNLLNDLL